MRRKLILSFALVVLISIVGMVGIARYTSAGTVREFMFPGGMISSTELVKSLEAYYQEHLSWQGVESLINSQRGNNQGKGWGYGAAQGGGMMRGNNGMMGQRILLADENRNILYDSDSQAVRLLSNDEIAQSIPLHHNNKVIGYLLLQGGMGFTQADERQLVTRLGQAAIFAGVLAGTVALVIALILANRLQKPVRDLTLAAQNLANGDLDQSVQVVGKDEIGLLGRTFNQMAGSLRKDEQMRKALTADIAHELRNPLAVQRANLEALLDGVYPLNNENILPILEQNQLLTRLVDDLRTLALVDAGQLSLQKIPVAMREFCEHLVEIMQPQARKKGIRIVFEDNFRETSEDDFILGDPHRLEQILGNVLSNAIRYTPIDGQVKILIQGDLKDIIIQVHDSGEGIPEDALPYLFDRFYRVDKSRSRDQGGTGLGLSIARQLAQAHGGNLIAENSPEGGAIFTLRLPKMDKNSSTIN